jgi:hypothetical protein
MVDVPGAMRSENASRIEPKPKGSSVDGSSSARRVSLILREASSLRSSQPTVDCA